MLHAQQAQHTSAMLSHLSREKVLLYSVVGGQSIVSAINNNDTKDCAVLDCHLVVFSTHLVSVCVTKETNVSDGVGVIWSQIQLSMEPRCVGFS